MPKKFKQYTANKGIIIKNTLIKAYYSINIIKYYYKFLRWVYSIIIIKILNIKPDLALQMFFKTINNYIDPSKLVFI